MLLDVIKDGELVDTHELSASKRVYKVGRQAGVADIVLTHGSISREHATITVSASGSVVVVDLGSAQGTKISGKPLVPNKPHLLPPGRSLTFGQSTRTFKLREGGSGFVSGEAGAAAVARAPQSAASLDDPRVQPVLQVLRSGASDCERPRPDGFVRLLSVVASAAVQRVGCTELELASLPARFVNVFETSTEAGVLLLRALDGHEPSLRVQPRLKLVPDPSPPSILFFGSTFREWNAVRSNGVGAGRTPPGPIFLSAHPPPLGAKLGSLGRPAELHVLLRTESMRSEGLSFYTVECEAQTGAGVGGAAAEAEGAPAASVAAASAGPALGPALEGWVCVGDVDTGLVGPWHFASVVHARDGSVLMSEEEIEPLRQARARRSAELLASKKAALEVAEVRQRQKEAAMRRRDEQLAEEEAPRRAKRFNPYLAHRQDAQAEEDED